VQCSLECGLSAQHGYWAVGGDARGHVELFDLQAGGGAGGCTVDVWSDVPGDEKVVFGNEEGRGR